MRHDDKNERRRIRFVVSMDAQGDETEETNRTYEEINRIYQLLRTDYANRNLTVGGVRETKDTRRMR